MFEQYITKTGRISPKQPREIKTQWYIQKFIDVHGDTYDYSKTVYPHNNKQKTEIICRVHGSFYQRPNDHIQGSGCPLCAGKNHNTIYVVKCLRSGLTKIGITNNLKQRLSSIGGNLEVIFSVKTANPKEVENFLHSKYQAFRKTNDKVFTGNTEFFDLNQYQIEDIVRHLEGL